MKDRLFVELLVPGAYSEVEEVLETDRNGDPSAVMAGGLYYCATPHTDDRFPTRRIVTLEELARRKLSGEHVNVMEK